MRDYLKEKASLFGAASAAYHSTYNHAMNRVARKLAAQYDNSDAIDPSEEELADLRHRYIEQTALDKECRESWDLHAKLGWDPIWLTPAGFLLRFLYRLVVLSAAIVILYQYFGPLSAISIP